MFYNIIIKFKLVRKFKRIAKNGEFDIFVITMGFKVGETFKIPFNYN